MPTFPIEEFISLFPSALGFNYETGMCRYDSAYLMEMGNKAMMHIGPERAGMPMAGHPRHYAWFLCTLHLIELNERAKKNGDNGGIGGMSGVPFKATIGSVQIENTKPNTFTTEDWDYWFKQTEHGRELLAYLDVQAPAGVFINTPYDSVRDLV